MRTSALLLSIGAIALLAACRKDNDGDCPDPEIPAAPLSVSAFSQLTPGNYWVYDWYRVDSLDIVQPGFHHVDSFVVVGDTLMNGNLFSFIQRYTDGAPAAVPGFGVFFWRDSADFILSGNTPIFASATFNEDIHVDSIPVPNNVAIHYAVSPVPVSVSVPAGTFDSYVVTGTCFSYGSFPYIPPWKYPRTYWAPGIGRVKWYAYYASGDVGNRYQLRSYYVQ